METISQTDLAEVLGVEVRTLRQWRVSDFEGTRKYLPAHRKDKVTESFYYMRDVMEWAERNLEYKDRLLALVYAPICKLLPRSSQIQITPPPDFAWWLSLHKENSNEHA